MTPWITHAERVRQQKYMRDVLLLRTLDVALDEFRHTEAADHITADAAVARLEKMAAEYRAKVKASRYYRLSHEEQVEAGQRAKRQELIDALTTDQPNQDLLLLQALSEPDGELNAVLQ